MINMMCRLKIISLSLLLLSPAVQVYAQAHESFGPADPSAKDTATSDPKRPMAQEMQANVPDGFAISAVGDLIISRPLSQYGKRHDAFNAVLNILQRSDVAVGNLETSIFDPRTFEGSPYAFDGDWTVSALPSVAKDLKSMGFDIVARANNHAQDWGLEGMRETSHWLDEAGIAHAGTGDTHGIARAPQYFESDRGRVALVSFASTFRPTSETLPISGATPGRPGVSALHLKEIIHVPATSMQALAKIHCDISGQYCEEAPSELTLFGKDFQQADEYSHQHNVNTDDLAEINKNIRAAQQNADFVIVSVHSHDCSSNCDSDNQPSGVANFLKQVAHDAIDSGADMFFVTGIHNLGPIEIYDSPARGHRPIFYGLGNFFWSDIQEFLPSELFDDSKKILSDYWQDPAKATEYDLSAPLNALYFANAFTFQSVIADIRFKHNQLSEIILHPIELGYGKPLTESGIPSLVTNKSAAKDIFSQIEKQTKQYGLPDLKAHFIKNSIVIKP